MSKINKITLDGVTYEVEDSTARRMIESTGGDPSAPGANLATLFSAEIAAAPHSGNVWSWIKARITAGNFNGLAVGDSIPFTADGNSYNAEIAGINTYKGYGDTEVGNHIDFITRECHPTAFVMNRANYNNGTTVSPSPWLASDLYARLNSLQQDVPNTTTAGGTPLVNADFRTTGILTTLPQALRDVIVQKRLLLPRRYTAGELLTDDNNWDWSNAGLLWLPSEMEVYGANMWGSLVPASPGYSLGGFQQYPIFAHNMRRAKRIANGGDRTGWWLLSARGGASTHFAYVSAYGYANSYNATTSTIRVPLCFRIA